MPPEQPIRNSNLQQLKESILGLVLACPFDGSKPAECQLGEIRKLSLKARFAWVNELKLEQAQVVWGSHVKCRMAKEIKKAK